MSINATVTANNPGPFGDLIYLEFVYTESAPDLVVTLDSKVLTLTIGTTDGVANKDWHDLAALANADDEFSSLCSMTGVVDDFSAADPTESYLVGGNAGLGLGQFYAAPAPGPPPPVRPPRLCTTL